MFSCGGVSKFYPSWQLGLQVRPGLPVRVNDAWASRLAASLGVCDSGFIRSWCEGLRIKPGFLVCDLTCGPPDRRASCFTVSVVVVMCCCRLCVYIAIWMMLTVGQIPNPLT